jgi:hypothetical protein
MKVEKIGAKMEFSAKRLCIETKCLSAGSKFKKTFEKIEQKWQKSSSFVTPLNFLTNGIFWKKVVMFFIRFLRATKQYFLDEKFVRVAGSITIF